MHRSELESNVRCAVCGTFTFGEQDRAYVIDVDDAVCYACAAELGGVYDEEQARWVEPPKLPDNILQPPA